MKRIVLIAALLLSSHAISGDSDLFANVEGIYEGSLFSGADMDPVITSFQFENGQLSGKYAMGEEEGLALGSLADIQVESPYSLSMTWTDKYGEGTLRILFSEDYQAFNGFWGYSETPVRLPWSGIKR